VTEEYSWESKLQPRARAEAKIIVKAFGDRGVPLDIGFDRGRATERDDVAPGGIVFEDDAVTPGGIAFMYAKGQFLAREQYLGDVGTTREFQPIETASEKKRGVLDILKDEDFEEVQVTRVVRDIVLIRLRPRAGKDAPGEPPDVLPALERIDRELGVGIATPDHVLTAANGEMHPCAATEPEEVHFTAGPYPAVCRDGGARVRIFVADTGLLENAGKIFPWLEGVHGKIDTRTVLDGAIQPYGGHGTFVAGVLRCMAPEAQIHVANVFDTAGSATESELVPRLNVAFGFGFEILHLTASGMTRNNIPPLALEAWLELLRSYQGVVCVAPAGNNHTRRPSWPGAFPSVISVGALATDWSRRADFSDYGGWVDVYAPGQKLINAFGRGRYKCQFTANEEIRQFTGLAQWSGTSFSAPIVTGLIAARMARCGESAERAAAALLARARARTIPGVGPVLLPSCGGEDVECSGDRDRGCGRGRCGWHCCGGHG
jgi:hypothetical protein